MLNVARALRYLMVKCIFHNLEINSAKLKKTLNTEYINTDNYLSIGTYHIHPMDLISPLLSNKNDFISESMFMIYLLIAMLFHACKEKHLVY